jgi:hypothetical protein
MCKNIRIVIFIGLLIIILAPASTHAGAKTDIQVTLFSDRNKYVVDEPVSLQYEVLWLGKEDAYIYFNRLAFPELEVLYLNLYPVALQNPIITPVRSEPGRHEVRGFAPTMRGSSETFVINSPTDPLVFLNGKKGYYLLNKKGTYVIRAKFDISGPWKISDKQSETIWSNAIVIEITSNNPIQPTR